MALLGLLALVFAVSVVVGAVVSLVPVPVWLMTSFQITAAFFAAWLYRRY